MTTILPIGTTVCQACRQPVAIVRRTVAAKCRCIGWFKPLEDRVVRDLCDHTHAIPDVAWTVVDADGERHLCPAAG